MINFPNSFSYVLNYFNEDIIDLLSTSNESSTTIYPCDELFLLIDKIIELNLFDSISNLVRVLVSSFFIEYCEKIDEGHSEDQLFYKMLLFNHEKHYYRDSLAILNSTSISEISDYFFNINCSGMKSQKMNLVVQNLISLSFIASYDLNLNDVKEMPQLITEITLEIEGQHKVYKIPPPPLEYMIKVKNL